MITARSWSFSRSYRRRPGGQIRHQTAVLLHGSAFPSTAGGVVVCQPWRPGVWPRLVCGRLRMGCRGSHWDLDVRRATGAACVRGLGGVDFVGAGTPLPRSHISGAAYHPARAALMAKRLARSQRRARSCQVGPYGVHPARVCGPGYPTDAPAQTTRLEPGAVGSGDCVGVKCGVFGRGPAYGSVFAVGALCLFFGGLFWSEAGAACEFDL